MGVVVVVAVGDRWRVVDFAFEVGVGEEDVIVFFFISFFI